MTGGPPDEPAGGRLRRTLRRTFLSLRSRNFRLYFTGQLVSNTGNWLTNVARVLDTGAQRGHSSWITHMYSLDTHDARLLVIAPLRIERAALRCGLPGALVLHSGMGAARSRSSAPAAARVPAGAVAVAGFCGALSRGLRPGDVVVASEVRGPEGVTVCEARPVVVALAALGIENVRVGPVASADHLVRGAERRALAAEGALAADMESAWLAPAAAGRPFAVLRVVLDTPDRELSRPLATLAGGLVAWRALRRAAPALALWARSRVGPSAGAAYHGSSTDPEGAL